MKKILISVLSVSLLTTSLPHVLADETGSGTVHSPTTTCEEVFLKNEAKQIEKQVARDELLATRRLEADQRTAVNSAAREANIVSVLDKALVAGKITEETYEAALDMSMDAMHTFELAHEASVAKRRAAIDAALSTRRATVEAARTVFISVACTGDKAAKEAAKESFKATKEAARETFRTSTQDAFSIFQSEIKAARSALKTSIKEIKNGLK